MSRLEVEGGRKVRGEAFDSAGYRGLHYGLLLMGRGVLHRNLEEDRLSWLFTVVVRYLEGARPH